MKIKDFITKLEEHRLNEMVAGDAWLSPDGNFYYLGSKEIHAEWIENNLNKFSPVTRTKMENTTDRNKKIYLAFEEGWVRMSRDGISTSDIKHPLKVSRKIEEYFLKLSMRTRVYLEELDKKMKNAKNIYNFTVEELMMSGFGKLIRKLRAA